MLDPVIEASMATLPPAAVRTSVGFRVGPIIRWRAWAFCKITFLIACLCYAMLSRPRIDLAVVGETGLLFVMFCCYAAFGYAVNSFSDATADAKAGKRNPFSMMSGQQAARSIGVISAITLAAGGIVSAYYWRADVTTLVASAYALAAIYSLAPVRLKERGLLGVFASALAQRTIPAVIVATATETWDRTSLSLCVLSTMIGIRYILIHQIYDEQADRSSNVRTFGTVHGGEFVRRLIRTVVLPMELIALVTTLAFLAPAFPAIPLAAGAVLLLNALHPVFNERAPPLFKADDYETLAPLYYFYLPVVLAGYIVMRDVNLWPVLGFVLVWTSSRLKAEMERLLAMRRALKRHRKKWIRSGLRARSQ
jgi:4-hydroxybenzoate polyprenyltransferase